MKTDVEHGGIVLKDVLCAVAMVDVPIEDCDLLCSMPLQGVTGSYCGIIEETESHRPVALCMMSRRSNGTEGRTHFLTQNQVNGIARRPCGIKGDLVRPRADMGVSFIQHSATPHTRIPDALDVYGIVDGKHLSGLRRGGRTGHEPLQQSRDPQSGLDGPKAIRPLDMALRCPVLKKQTAGEKRYRMLSGHTFSPLNGGYSSQDSIAAPGFQHVLHLAGPVDIFSACDSLHPFAGASF
jgi:hypothetical protein